jgi:hypothetical protein
MTMGVVATLLQSVNHRAPSAPGPLYPSQHLGVGDRLLGQSCLPHLVTRQVVGDEHDPSRTP